jgi:hypothetical protein
MERRCGVCLEKNNLEDFECKECAENGIPYAISANFNVVDGKLRMCAQCAAFEHIKVGKMSHKVERIKK